MANSRHWLVVVVILVTQRALERYLQIIPGPGKSLLINKKQGKV
jgi:hypothetical protein